MSSFDLRCSDPECQRCASGEPRRLLITDPRHVYVTTVHGKLTAEELQRFADADGGRVTGPDSYLIPSRIVHIE